MIATTPNSEIEYSATNSAPAPAAGAICGSVMVRKARSGPSPSVLATSSTAVSARRSAAATGSVTYGVVTSTSTDNEPQ